MKELDIRIIIEEGGTIKSGWNLDWVKNFQPYEIIGLLELVKDYMLMHYRNQLGYAKDKEEQK